MSTPPPLSTPPVPLVNFGLWTYNKATLSLVGYVAKIRRESTTEEMTLPVIKFKARTVVGRGGERGEKVLLRTKKCDHGSGLRLGGGRNKGGINERDVKKKTGVIGHRTGLLWSYSGYHIIGTRVV